MEGQNIRGVDEEIGSVVGGHVPAQLRQVFREFPLRDAPGEIRVRLLETDLTEGRHHLRFGEGLGQEDDLRVGLVHPLQQPVPELHGFGVGVVHPEDRHAAVDPQLHDPQHLLVDALGIVVEVQGIDVLVLLGRVLRVGDGPVQAGGEPFGMFLHPRMVGGGLEGEVEGQLQSEGLRLRDEPLEGLEITQVGVDGVVPAVERTDGPRGPRVVGGRVETVVLPLPEGRTDGMDRGQVGHVETHRRDRLETRVRGVETTRDPVALLVAHGPLGAREELVPRRVEGAAAFDADRVFLGGGDRFPGAEPRHGAFDGTRVDQILDLADGGVWVQRLGRGA